MRHRRFATALLGSACALLVAQASQAQVDIADAPLFLVPEVAPNILYILDDSGSMNLSFIPEEICGQRTTRRVKSASYNTLYYDPYVTYSPPLDHNGNSLGDARFTDAKSNGYASSSSTVDLSDNFRPTWSGSSTGCSDSNTYAQTSGEPAYYYVFFEDHWEPQTRPSGCSTTDPRNDDDCYIKVVVGSQSGPGGADERTNFANWYQYYRTRLMAAKAGSSRAFATLPTTPRVGYGRLNQGSNTIDGVSTTTLQRGVRAFEGASRKSFFDWLFGMGTQTYTPLRRALDAAGQYFTREDARGPYSTTPGSFGGELLSCRANYTILMSDGYWNDAQAATSGARQNNDGRDGPTITGPGSQSYRYTATSPFTDGYSNTLADVAMYYWKNDLAPNLTNNVPTSAINPAFWQHMVTFGVGLGVPTAVDPDEAFAAITTGAPIQWQDPQVSNSGTSVLARSDELLHAAVNSRGGFFNAQNPADFTERLSRMLDDIVARVEGSSTSAATSSAVLQTDTYLYTAGFRSTDWSGSFNARAVDPETGAVGAVVWDAEARLRSISPALRRILTVNSATGAAVELDFGNLSAEQQEALHHRLGDERDGLGAERVEWLRGDDNVNTAFRSRASTSGVRLLGDIVHSNPQFVTNTDYGYSLLPGEGSGYRAFRASIASRPDVIYVGSNDGMLHAFDAETGDEHFAFIPSELLLPEPGKSHAPVSRLTDPDYTHRFFVDGTAAISDAFIGGSWRTVLVGSMGAGGRTVFALDITDPVNPGVLWEFSHADLGYNVGKPSIARMRNGDWAAIFGNGYNGASNEASLFIVRLSDGTLLRQLSVGATTSANGLAAPVVTDWPRSDLLASHVYAGDLLGNLWRFDVTTAQSSSWSVDAVPLFTATDAGGTPQPITATPAVAMHPQLGNTLVVMFGTGSYFRTGDGGDLQVQTLYGVFDTAAGASGLDRGGLRRQEILSQGTASFSTAQGTLTYELRNVSAYELGPTDRGWYLDLVYTSAEGERVISAPTFPSGLPQNRVRFTTVIPDTSDPCASSRRGFLMDIDIGNGGRSPTTVFDLNLDGEFDDEDWFEDLPPSGVGFGSGELPTVIRQPDAGREILYSGDGEETVFGAAEGFGGRQSWRQLR